MKIVICSIASFLFTFAVNSQTVNYKSIFNEFHSVIEEYEHSGEKIIKPEDIYLDKDFLYDQHTLEDTYPYKKGTRQFQWDKIRERLAFLETIQQTPVEWAIVCNYKNRNGQAATARKIIKNEYNNVADTFYVERYQSAPLYLTTDSIIPERYLKDGSLIIILNEGDKFYKIKSVRIGGEWLVPKKYVKRLNGTGTFEKAIAIDRTNQNITTLEKVDSKWLIRSMNPATTGVHQPPFKHETPLGIFVIQQKTPKMLYYKDGTTDIGGSSPYANRFSSGAYIHGVPVDLPRVDLVEFSQSLGTTPRSHMCVRNATSHAKYIYDWGPIEKTVVFIFD